jgi:threonine dehydratase
MKNKLFDEIINAKNTLEGVAVYTPLTRNTNLSKEFGSEIFLKREDFQVVRSYKIRGAFNKIKSLNVTERAGGVVCASAGNHAQGVAYSCSLLNSKAKIYMPGNTPKQKVKQVKLFGKTNIEIILEGETYDDAYKLAQKDALDNNLTFIHPFDDYKVIAGQGTIGLEILEAINMPVDYIFVPIGGGGLASGIVTVFSKLSPNTKIIGVEPAGAASMKLSIEKGINTTLQSIDRFVDGAAVQRVGDLAFKICKKGLSDIIAVPEGKVCSTMLRLYNEEAMVVEPAGALTIAALDLYSEKIKGKVVVCIISGSNNDIMRMEEVKERSLFYEGLIHYFMILFQQKSGFLKEFVSNVLSEEDDITYFRFSQMSNRERGSAIVGIQLENKENFKEIERKLKERKFQYTYLNDNAELYNQLLK